MYHSAVQLEYEITLPELLQLSWFRRRSSISWIFAIVACATAVSLGVLLYVPADPWPSRLAGGSSAFFLLILLVVPSLNCRLVYRRNRRLFATRKVTISEEGIVADSQLGHAETNWESYVKFRKTKNLFLLYQSKDIVGILPKRVFTNQEDLEKVRALIASKVRRA